MYLVIFIIFIYNLFVLCTGNCLFEFIFLFLFYFYFSTVLCWQRVYSTGHCRNSVDIATFVVVGVIHCDVWPNYGFTCNAASNGLVVSVVLSSDMTGDRYS